ncbi:ATP-dependent kinase YFH7 [Rhynchospora pubera]|uniref:ATP-dependent kinase YFH7 n=1 Tax=Rhynchospora pubera TaxID=906938 RepID=A0AAV8BQS7_9POAL|nr:ATP-dependent kinase YFH7 [Rhynchospora pubera]
MDLIVTGPCTSGGEERRERERERRKEKLESAGSETEVRREEKRSEGEMHLSLRCPVKTPNCLLFSASAPDCSPCATRTQWHQFWRSIPPNTSINLLPLKSTSLTLQYSNRRQKVLFCQKQQAPLLDCRSIEEVYDSLAQHLFSTLLQIQDFDSKYIVGLVGPPGAGKSTLAGEVVCRINLLWSKVPLQKGSKGEVATVLPMDGFHLYRSQLDQMEDPKEAHARRGAPWTFNPDLLRKCLYTLRKEGSVYAPSFDHGVGDPVENDIHVSSEHKIVIVEGNYLLLEEDTWKEISLFFDEKWFIDIDIDIAMERVLKRHISTGKEPDVAAWRIEYNDRPNAELIMRSKNKADLVIQSIDI